ISGHGTLAAHFSILQWVIRDRIYLKCLQLPGHPPAPGAIAPAKPGTCTTIDVPGSSITNPAAINPARAIASSYSDAGRRTHSFLRAPDGTITTCDPPGATCSLSTQNTCSAAVGITPEGTVVGSYSEANDVLHGFLRGPNGAFTVFDPPGSIDTGAAAVNQDGAITGFFGSSIVNGSLIAHGFLRTRNGTFTTFDPPG